MVVFEQPSIQKESRQHNPIRIEPQKLHLKKDQRSEWHPSVSVKQKQQHKNSK
jgi:hypothetical protein